MRRRTKKRLWFALGTLCLAFVALLWLAAAYGPDARGRLSWGNVRATTSAQSASPAVTPRAAASQPTPIVADGLQRPPKYVFLFIGDGMGATQVAAASAYRGAMLGRFAGTIAEPTPENPPQMSPLAFQSFPVTGWVATHSASSYITDSAAAGTAMATGVKTLDGALGLDATGNAHASIAEMLQQRLGYKIGIITSVSLDHATPAAFYAHVAWRENYYEIGQQLVSSGFDFFGGGSLLSIGLEGGQTPILELARQQGYTIVNTQEAVMALNASSGKVIAIHPELEEGTNFFQYAMDGGGSLTLADFVRKGIDALYQETGFFILCEGGKIDLAAHENDAMTLIREVLELEAAIEVAMAFYRQYPEDTLILVTADHETGGMSLGNATTQYDAHLPLLSQQTQSYAKFAAQFAPVYAAGIAFEDALAWAGAVFGLHTAAQADANPMLALADVELQWLYDYAHAFPGAALFLFNQRAGIGWSTTAHTAQPVPIYALGNGAEGFGGWMDNTEIFQTLAELCGLMD